MGPSISDPVYLPFPEPEINKKELVGQVLWTDHFGNLITNIHQEALIPFLSGSVLTVSIGSETIPEILQTYSQGLPGRLIALIGSSGYLEIACNLGRAAEKLGFQPTRELNVRVTST
jgi:S-adenosyl-L-methionine hydrolase (adenosine-forming)